MKRLGVDVFEVFPFAFFHQRADIIFHALNIAFHATGGSQLALVKCKMTCQQCSSRFADFFRRNQTDRFLAVFGQHLLKPLLRRPFLGNVKRNIFRSVFVWKTDARAIQPSGNQRAIAPTFGAINICNHIFPSLARLTQFLKIRFDLAFQHPDHAANSSQRRQLAGFRLPSHCSLADTENLLQFREPYQAVIKLMLR
ncbi:MAG: hypothetical protein WBS33_07635 [Verrucomicrobiia bacterium]